MIITIITTVLIMGFVKILPFIIEVLSEMLGCLIEIICGIIVLGVCVSALV